MKKYMAPAFLAAALLFFIPASAEKIKVLVEGEGEVEQKATADDGIYIKEEKPGLLNKRRVERDKKTEELKKLIENQKAESDIEKEVMDAIISKIITIEEELDRQDRMQFYIITGGLALFAVLLVVIFIRKKE